MKRQDLVGSHGVMGVPPAGGINASFIGHVSSLRVGQPCDFGPFN